MGASIIVLQGEFGLSSPSAALSKQLAHANTIHSLPSSLTFPWHMIQ